MDRFNVVRQPFLKVGNCRVMMMLLLSACTGGGEDTDQGSGIPSQSFIPQAVHPSIVFVDLQANGSGSVCGIAEAGETLCWGKNEYGELGTQSPIANCGGIPCTGKPQTVETQLRFASLTAGSPGVGFYCGLLQSGEAYCWGFGIGGQLGDGNRSNSHIPVPVAGGHHFVRLKSGYHGTCGLTATAEVHCWGAGVGGFLADDLAHFADFDLGEMHSCGITDSGEAYCWGSNWYGQTTGGEPGQLSGIRQVLRPKVVEGVSGLTSIVAGGDTSCGLNTAGQAFCWGSTTGTSSGAWPDAGPHLVEGDHVFVSLHAGLQHICGLTIDGEAYCWGGIGSNLGGGSDSYSEVPRRVATNVRFKKLSHWPTCGISESGGAYCWGSNLYGEIGKPPYWAEP